ncbi:MAG TPA: hypothetical protein VGB99_12485 [Acidobacteriota bacterium]
MRSAAALLLLGLAARASSASSPALWTVSLYEQLVTGQPEGVRLSADGALTIGPKVEEIFRNPDDPTLWSLITEPGGSLVVGTGVAARLFRILPEAKGWRGTQVFDAEELQVTALAVTRDGKVRFATAPEGALYQLEAAGASEIHRPRPAPDRYIWDLALAADGSMWLATGTDGRIYRVDGDGDAKLVYDSDQTHITALAVGSKGELYAGSDGDGLVYRIEPDGRAQVLYDAPLREIRALAPGPRGVLYALAVGERAAAAPELSRPAVVQPPLPGETAMPLPPAFGAEEPAPAEPPAVVIFPPAAPAPSGPRGELYRLDPDGAVTRLWSSRTEIPLSLLLDGEDAVLIGTGDRGRIYRIEVASASASLWARVEAAQVTALARAEDGAVLAACSHAGRVYRLAGQAERASYQSPVYDAGAQASWGAILADADIPSGAGLELETRSGNSAQPNDTWSAWSAVRSADGGAQAATSPPARFLQWRATLRAGAAAAPELRSVGVVYQRLNGKPDLTRVLIDPPGAYYRSEPEAGESDAFPAELLGLENGSPAREARSVSGGTAGRRFRNGWRSIRWEAEDPDGDRMSFAVYLKPKALGDAGWKLLAQDLDQPRYSFDTTAFPDGSYQARITASDAPSNPEASARLDAALSAAFPIDNTGPELLEFEAAQGWARFRVRDAISPLRRVEVSFDGSQWKLVSPVDGALDGLEERFEVALGASAQTQGELSVRATDLALNSTVERRPIPQ